MGSSRFFVSSRTNIGDSENINPTKKSPKPTRINIQKRTYKHTVELSLSKS